MNEGLTDYDTARGPRGIVRFVETSVRETRLTWHPHFLSLSSRDRLHARGRQFPAERTDQSLGSERSDFNIPREAQQLDRQYSEDR